MIEFIFVLNRKIKARFITFFLRFGFKSFGKKSLIYNPSILKGIKDIDIGSKVTIFDYSWIMVIEEENKRVRLKIGNNTDIGRLCHIVTTGEMRIGDDVLIADKVYISDTAHTHQNNIPIKKQGLEFIGNVVIGNGSWIGEGAIIYGCKIGDNCVVGANSFVNKDVPDNSIAIGSPAVIYEKNVKV